MRTIQFREAICEAMSEEMRSDDSIYLMGEEVAEYNGAYKASKGMLDEFGPDRVIDTPISELGFAGIAIGSTMTGNRPIVEYMTFNFSLVGIDQIINNAAKIRQMSGGQFKCPIVFRGPTASAGQLAATHSQAFENWFANTPGLKVIVPSNPYDAKGLLKSAIRDDDPVKKTNRLVILEEAWPFGNVATEITYQVQSNVFDFLDAPIEKINTADTPAPYSPVLLKEWLPNSNDVVNAVKKVMYK